MAAPSLSQVVIAPALQEYYVDKLTGAPLAGGIITYYSDINRTTLKPVWTISGSPPNYSFVQLPNPLTLSAVGTPMDASGNPIFVYYAPYLQDSLGNYTSTVENYYITVTNSLGTQEFTREGWPNVGAGGGDIGTPEFINFAPNGQFLFHNDIPAVAPAQAGQLSELITDVAPGDWTFERSSNLSTDFVTFERFNAQVTNPTSSPRYAITLSCTIPHAGDTKKNLCLTFPDVNKFASNSQAYRIYLSIINNGAGNVPVQVSQYRNFGTGGTTAVTLPITTFTAMPSWTAQQISFIPGDNSSYSLGTDETDYLQLLLQFPATQTYNISITCFVFCVDNGAISQFPITPNNEMSYEAITGQLPIPAFDGSDYYLPIVATPLGATYFRGQIGEIVGRVTPTTSAMIGEIFCDGRQLEAAAKSADGIPYSRLFNILFDPARFFPKYGTGAPFVNGFSYSLNESANDGILDLSTNTAGLTTDASVGTSGFTVATPIAGYAGGTTGYITTVAGVAMCIFNAVGTQTLPITDVPGATIDVLRDQSDFYYVFTITLPAASSAYEGKYIAYGTNFIWFTVGGTGSIPTPGSPYVNAIKIDLLANYTAVEVASYVRYGFNGSQVSRITVPAATSGLEGKYFLFYTLTNEYYVWYTFNGVGVDPAVADKIAIEVDTVTGQTAAQVAETTITAINSKYFAIPDFRGLSLRGVDPTPTWDFGPRYTSLPLFTDDDANSFELDTNQSHFHSIAIHELNDLAGGSPSPFIKPGDSMNTNSQGGSQSQPINANVWWYIKY